jgi:hypothetical protein
MADAWPPVAVPMASCPVGTLNPHWCVRRSVGVRVSTQEQGESMVANGNRAVDCLSILGQKRYERSNLS